MKTILVIESSAGGNESVSRLLVQDAITALLAAYPDSQVIRRDLGREPVPHLAESNLAGLRGDAATAEQRAARARSDSLIAELRAADILLIGAPMYNFSVPTALRAWFDHVLRAGETFSYSEAGPKGLLSGRQAIIVETRGGSYSEGPAMAIDFQEPYLRQLLGFIGITDVTFVRAEKLAFGPEARSAAIAGAREALARLVGPPRRVA
jgi:FMN-dependent NADH-azoreductase